MVAAIYRGRTMAKYDVDCWTIYGISDRFKKKACG